MLPGPRALTPVAYDARALLGVVFAARRNSMRPTEQDALPRAVCVPRFGVETDEFAPRGGPPVLGRAQLVLDRLYGAPRRGRPRCPPE